MRLRVAYYALLLIAGCAAIVASLYYVHERRNSTVESLMTRFPVGDSVVFYVDAESLRKAGLIDLLAGKDSEIDAEYAQFVRESGFNYTTDLDSALVSFHGDTTYFLLRGRFDWGRLFRFVEEGGGVCENGFCRLYASDSERFISFFAVTPSIMAMASGSSSWDAETLDTVKPSAEKVEAPPDPFWVTIPSDRLLRYEWLPAGSRYFASALAGNGKVTFTINPNGNDFEAAMKAECRGPVEAAQLATELKRITDLLTSLIDRQDQQPNPNDLSGPLTAGVFDQQGSEVHGRWPISRSLVETIASGREESPASR